MKYLLILLTAVLLTGCEDKAAEYSGTDVKLPNGLADCRTFIATVAKHEVYVIRCPNSQTSTERTWRQGKTTRHDDVTTIEN